MTTFRITVQEARVIERSYDIVAPDADEASDLFSELDTVDAAKLLVHEETIRSHWEIIGCEEAKAT